MHISVIVGSLRADSINRKIFNQYQALAKGIFEFSEVKTSDFPLFNSDLAKECLATITPHADTIRQSDGLLFFCPEYNYSLPGHVKNAIDWLSIVDEQPFNNKKAAIIGASPGNVGTARMQYDLRKIGVYLNLHFLNKPEMMIGQSFSKFNDDGVLTDDKTLSFLDEHVKNFKAFLAT